MRHANLPSSRRHAGGRRARARLQHPDHPNTTPTFEWTFNEGSTVGTLPSTQWLADGTLMLLDTPLPAAQRSSRF